MGLRRYKWKSVEVGVFRMGVGHFERKFQAEGASATNHCWCQKSRVIALSCVIKISALFDFVTKDVCDGQTDGRTDGQIYDSQDRSSIAARAVESAALSFAVL